MPVGEAHARGLLAIRVPPIRSALESNKLTLQDTVRISDGVVFRELEGEAVLLNLETGVYFGLNGVGTRIWMLLGDNGALGSVFTAIQQEFDVAPERLEKDLLGLVQQLREKGLVEEHLSTPA